MIDIAGEDETTLGEFATEILGDSDTLGANLAEMDGDDLLGDDILGDDVDGDDAGAWLHKLNPAYWFKSSRQRKMTDIERQAWIDNAEANKRKAKQEKELAAAQKALVAKQAARASASESQAIEAQLQDVESSLASGIGDDSLGSFVGKAKRAAGKNKKVCAALANKIEKGEKLTPEETRLLRGCLKTTDLLRKLHRRLHAMDVPGTKPLPSASPVAATTSGYRDERGPRSAFLGEFSTEILGEVFSGDFVGGRKYPDTQWQKMSALAAVEPKKLPAFMAKNNIVLDRVQQGHLKQLTTLTRKALVKQVKASPAAAAAGIGADDLEGDFVGSFKSFMRKVGKVAAVAALPAAGVAWLTYKGVRGAGKLIAKPFRKKKANPQQAQRARLAALQKRREAARARAEAAAAKTEAAREEAQARAEAAAADAEAKDAEAAAAQAEAEAQQDPPPDAGPEEGDYSEGDDLMGYDESQGEIETMGADDFSGDFVGAIKNPKHKKIVKAAASKTPLGMKIRAGAAVYKAAKKGNPKAKLAIKKVQVKAKKGDPQAKRDLNAIKAGKVALNAKGLAKAKIAYRAKAQAANKKGIAVRSKLEAAAAARLSRMSHKRQLAQAAKVEKAAARGNPKAKKIVAKVVAKAKAGDKKAQTSVKAMQLSRRVRQQVKTPAEARRVRQAQAVLRKAKAGNKKAIRQVRTIQAAAKGGNPNAKRAVKRLKIANHIETAVQKGKVVPPKKPPTAAQVKKERIEQIKKYAKKRQAGAASREEAIAAARAAHQLGLKERAGQFAMDARTLRPAKQDIKNAATVAAAAQQGEPVATAKIEAVKAKAMEGDPAAIKATGNLVAAQQIDAIKHGQPMSPQVAEATQIVARQQAGDPEAERTIQRAAEAAHRGDPKGVEAAVALSAAGAVLAATAATPLAQRQWKEQAAGTIHGPRPTDSASAQAQTEFRGLYHKVKTGTATREEAERARQLGGALRAKPSVIAEISALMPPRSTLDALSSMPDAPLPPIRGGGSLIKESLRALFFCTPDPLGNYREGVQSRGATRMLPPTTAGDND